MILPKIYVIYMGAHLFYEGGKVVTRPVLMDVIEARKRLFEAQRFMEHKATILQSCYKPTIRKVVSVNPLRFANEEVNRQFEMNLTNQTQFSL